MDPREKARQLLLAGALITPMGAFLVYAGYRIEERVMSYIGMPIVALGVAFLAWGAVSLRRAPRPGPAVADAGPGATVSHAPQAEQPPSLQEMEQVVMDIASRSVPTTREPTFHFICSGNESLIRAYYGLLRVGAPVYGGSAAILAAENDDLAAAAGDEDALRTAFGGTRCMASDETALATVADVLADAARVGVQRAFVALAVVGPDGLAWMRETYLGVMQDAVRQGILPYPMYVTAEEAGAAGVYRAFRLVEGEPLVEGGREAAATSVARAAGRTAPPA